MVTTTADLNLRAGPGTANRVLAVLPKGTRIQVTGDPLGVWWPVRHLNTSGWVNGDYLAGLPEPEDTVNTAHRDALLSYLHIPYIWGGQSRAGLDCSGLVGEWWKQIGFRPAGFDTTADKLFDGYRTGTLPGQKLASGQFGALAFYGSGTYAGHVAVCYDEATIIGANGGGKSVDTVAEARARNACVRLDRIDYRNDLLGIWLPRY